MPANKSYRQGAGKQRHHKHRLGRMLVPHGYVSGLLFTVNPRQESKALRELRLYLHPLIADLEKAHKEELNEQKEEMIEGQLREENRQELSSVDTEEILKKPVLSTSSLLAAELAEYVPGRVGRHNDGIRAGSLKEKDDITDNNSNNDNEDAGNNNDNGTNTAFLPSRKRPRKNTETASCRQWLAQLETGCKGYLMVSIPFSLQKRILSEEKAAIHAEYNVDDEVTDGSTSQHSAHDGTESHLIAKGGTPPHTILHNPLVQTVVERIFTDIEENPRPLLRHCFRLMPCELTCCPTLPEMRIALELLLAEHFPLVDGPARLHRVSLSFKVKNNTGVENKKAYFQAALETLFPVNRFVLVPASRIKSCDIVVEMVFCVLVAHATCAMGVQRHFAERSEYNIHAIGAKHLELSSSV